MGRIQTIGKFSHQVSGEVVWLTPRWLLNALGDFDLDPCAEEGWVTARRHLTQRDNGLTSAWKGFCFVNPPYGRTNNEHLWLAKLAAHQGGGIALVGVKPETRVWQESIWPHASAILMLNKRVRFLTADKEKKGTFGPSALISYGTKAATRLRQCGVAGALITSWENRRCQD